tara:strand:- start:163 stop:444 length:282 start_codon:yes stop_codon:yes gene_type:complete
MKNLILIITFSLSSMIYAQENTSDTITIYDTLYYDNGSIEYYIQGKTLCDTSENYTGDIYYFNSHNQLEYIAHFDEGELLGHTIYEPLKPEDN